MPAHTKRSKYSVLLENYPKVRRWFRNLERGSPITAKVGMRRLCRLTELLKMVPKEMVDKAKNELDGFQDLLEDMVASLESMEMT